MSSFSTSQSSVAQNYNNLQDNNNKPVNKLSKLQSLMIDQEIYGLSNAQVRKLLTTSKKPRAQSKKAPKTQQVAQPIINTQAAPKPAQSMFNKLQGLMLDQELYGLSNAQVRKLLTTSKKPRAQSQKAPKTEHVTQTITISPQEKQQARQKQQTQDTQVASVDHSVIIIRDGSGKERKYLPIRFCPLAKS